MCLCLKKHLLSNINNQSIPSCFICFIGIITKKSFLLKYYLATFHIYFIFLFRINLNVSISSLLILNKNRTGHLTCTVRQNGH